MSVDVLERPIVEAKQADLRCQWRGSHDAIVWTAWKDLPHIEALVPAFDEEGRQFAYGQARLLENGTETKRTLIWMWKKTE